MDVVDEVIFVDDVSDDQMVDIVDWFGLKVIVYFQNWGYGGNQKICYFEVFWNGVDVVVMVYFDNQYDVMLFLKLIQLIFDVEFDIVFGFCIVSGRVVKDGMLIWKYVVNCFLIGIENFVFGLCLFEYYIGFCVFSWQLLEMFFVYV